MKSFAISIAIFSAVPLHGEAVRHLRLEMTAEIQRAELYLWKPDVEVKAVMVFCPGHNGSGQAFVENVTWQRFAAQNQIALCGLSFASPMNLTKQGKGYSHAERESGAILLRAIDREFGETDLPLLFYGYSAGARFSTSFLAWLPQRVLAWCASGVGTWPDLPKTETAPPGVVACGEFDAACYWSSLHYFQTGREKKYPWAWISLENTGHSQSAELDDFIKPYFSLALNGKGKPFDEQRFDIATRQPVFSTEISRWRIFSSCLPSDRDITEKWTKIHHP